MTTVVVAGALATKPFNAGNAWTRISWAASFASLGFDVWLVERLPSGPPGEAALAWAGSIVGAHGFGGRTAVLGAGDEILLGPPADEVRAALASASVLLDIGGHMGTAGIARDAKVKVFLDDDPGFTQLWEASGSPGSRLADHDIHLTYGVNIGRPGCPVPTVGRRWHPVLPPVVLDEWPVAAPVSGAPFTTVATWRSPFGAVHHGGATYPQKHHEFRRVMALPAMVDADFEIALAIDPGDERDLLALRRAGWRVVDPSRIVADTSAYRAFVQSSAAEFSAAQGVYVHARSGWVSDRTVGYLASGRPALVQDTGASTAVPVGEGLVTYRTLDEAAAQANRLLEDPEAHGRAARALAEEFFDGGRIAAQVCELIGVAP